MRKNEKVAAGEKNFFSGCKNIICSDIFLSLTAKICSLSIKNMMRLSFGGCYRMVNILVVNMLRKTTILGRERE
jgi:hypothetical protein